MGEARDAIPFCGIHGQVCIFPFLDDCTIIFLEYKGFS